MKNGTLTANEVAQAVERGREIMAANSWSEAARIASAEARSRSAEDYSRRATRLNSSKAHEEAAVEHSNARHAHRAVSDKVHRADEKGWPMGHPQLKQMQHHAAKEQFHYDRAEALRSK